MAKMMSPNTTIWWVPFAGIANYLAPTVAEITAGINLSAAIVTGYTLAATDSDTDDSKTIVDEGNVQTPTFGNYEASLSFFRDGIGDAATAYSPRPMTCSRLAVLKAGWSPVTATSPPIAAATTQLVSVFGVVSDYHQVVEGDGGSPIQTTVPFKPTGKMALNVALV